MVGALALVLGVCIGSFLNVLIDRLPREQSIMGRSHCDSCKKTLQWFELIPVVSFVAQKARCRKCNVQLSLQYPLVEITSGVLFYALYRALPFSGEASFFQTVQYAAWFVVASAFFSIIVADFKYQIIPDSLLVVCSVAMLATLFPLSVEDLLFRSGVGLGAGGMFLLLWMATRGKGMGFGDVKLVTLMGFFLGFPHIIVALYVAFLTGAMYGVILMIAGRAGMKSRVAFGPFLLGGAAVAFFWSDFMLRYWGFL